MKLAIKSLVLTAAFVAASGANATSIVLDSETYLGPYGFWEGGATLEFGTMMMGALVTGNTSVKSFGGAVIDTVLRTSVDIYGESYEYDAKIVGVNLSQLSLDTATGKYTRLLSEGGVSQTMAANTGIKAAGGTAQMGNLDVRFLDNGNVEIYGTITGQRIGAETAVNYSGLVFTATAADASGVTNYPGPSTLHTATIQNLSATDDAFNALVQSFGLDPSGLGYSAFQQGADNVGTLRLSVLNSMLGPLPTPAPPAVPEPSTYALMSLGLMGLIWARRRAAT